MGAPLCPFTGTHMPGDSGPGADRPRSAQGRRLAGAAQVCWLPLSLSWPGRSPGGGWPHPLLFQRLASGSCQCPKYLQDKEEANHNSRSPPVPSPSFPHPGAESVAAPSQEDKALPSAGPHTFQPTQSSLSWTQDTHPKPFNNCKASIYPVLTLC